MKRIIIGAPSNPNGCRRYGVCRVAARERPSPDSIEGPMQQRAGRWNLRLENAVRIFKLIDHIALLLLFCLMAFPIGAVTAPVVHTNSFYVNDYATALYNPHRDAALALARDLYETTGTQAVILTVKSLSGYTLEDYGQDTLQGWDIGAPDGKGILLLVSTEDNASRVFVGEGLPSLAAHRDDSVDLSTGNNSRAIMEVYRAIVRDAYAAAGATPSEEIAGLLENPDAKTSGPFSAGTVIFLAVILICIARGYRVSRKYQKKYLKGHVRKVKAYTRTGDLEEAHYNNTINRIDFDGED